MLGRTWGHDFDMRTLVLGTATPTHAHGTVLTLNRRAATRLGARPQRLDSYAHRIVLEAGQAVASPTLAHRLLTEAVRETLQVADPGLVARSLTGTVREVLRGAVDLSLLAREPSPQVQRLAQVAGAYREALRSRSLIDAVEVVGTAARLAVAHPLTVFGYVRFSKDELAFLNAVAGDGSTVYLPWEDHPAFQDNLEAARVLEGEGWTLQRSGAPSEGLAGALLGRSGGSGSLITTTCEDDEVRAALREVKRLLQGGVAPEDIALVVNDDDAWAPRLRPVAWEYGVPIRFSTSVPLADTRVGRWVERVLTAVEEGATFESLAKVLAHPLDAGMDGTQWQRLRTPRPAQVPDWREVGLDVTGFDWPGQDSRRRWVDRLLSLLASRGVAERAARTQDVLALNFLRAELAVLATPADEQLLQAEFIGEVREVLALVTVPSDPGSTGVELLTPPSLVGALVPYVFVLGAADGQLPARLSDDPSLDFIERRRLARSGFPFETAATLARRDTVTFWALLQAVGETCTFSYARLSGGEARPSPLLANLPLRPLVRRTEACSPEEARRGSLAGDGLYTDPVLDAARDAYRVEVRRIQRSDYDEFDGLTGQPLDPAALTFSASQLGVLGRCGFRWWLEYALRLRDQTYDDQPLGLGRLRHSALEFAVKRAARQPDQDPRTSMLEALSEGLAHAEQQEVWPQTPEWTHERRDVLAGLRRAVQGEGFVQQGAVPLDAEQHFEGVWRGLKVRGMIDRIDQLGERLLIVDYKSGASKPLGVQEVTGRLGLDIQLPLYAEAALPGLYPAGKFGGAAYVSLRDGQVLGRIKIAPVDLDAFGKRIHASLAQGAFPPRPDVDFKTCRTCAWVGVCRGGERLERKVYP